MLDLDETLVASYNASRIPQHLLGGTQRYFIVPCSPCSNGSPNEIAVFPRPGLRAFLQQLSSIAEVILYTAGNAGESLSAHKSSQRSLHSCVVCHPNETGNYPHGSNVHRNNCLLCYAGGVLIL